MIWLIVSQVIAVLALIPWVLFLGTLSMGAALNSSSQTNASLFYLVISYPVALLVSIVGAWIFWRQKKLTLANVLTSIPMFYVIPGLIYVLVGVLG